MHKYTTDELVAQKPSAEEFKKIKRNPLYFILHNIRSLENVGLFFRLADALLVKKIFLTGYTGYPRLPAEASAKEGIDHDTRQERIITHAENEINKTAIKLVPFVPWHHEENVNTVIDKLKSESVQIVAVEQTDKSLDYTQASFHPPLALIFGHERTGVENELLDRADLIVHIPMLGMGNSHNVAMSAAIVANYIVQNSSLQLTNSIKIDKNSQHI